MSDELSGTVFCSSVARNAWTELAGERSFQSWHFDAISDDGREAVVIEFIDNYILSPRRDVEAVIGSHSAGRHPLVRFAYSVDGKRLLNSSAEFSASDLIASSEEPGCKIGRSGFRAASVEYGMGFVVTIDLAAFGGRRVRAELEWLSVESDLLDRESKPEDAVWNVAVPRADVSGKIELVSRSGKTLKAYHFRGTGYHDHIKSPGAFFRDLSSRMWGRAHFSDATLVFERHGGAQNHSAPGQFMLVKDGGAHVRNAACLASGHHSHHWGLDIPNRLSYISEDGIRIRIKPRTLISSGASEVKFLSEITLGLNDGKPRRTTGLTQFIDPRRIGNRVMRILSELKTGRHDRSPWF